MSSLPIRWGVLGGSSHIFRKSLRPAMLAAGHTIAAEPSREGESLAPYSAMLARPDIDAVYNPLPNHLHAEWTHRALDAGKHVLCEKPLTLSPSDTAAVFEHAAAAGLTVLEAYMWPHHPRAARVLQLAGSGELGWLQHGTASFSWPMDLAGGDHRLDLRGAGALFDVGIYCIAPFMLMARRDAVAVGANAVRNTAGVDIAMTGWVDWGGGFGSSFGVSFDAPSHRSMGLAASEAIVKVPGWHAPGPLEPSELVIERRDGTEEHLQCDGGDAYCALVGHFADVVAGAAQPVFGAAESLRLADVLQRLHVASAH
ncbi:MAG: Gfo/Idh/MocA family oxidoreductase [Acidimicrobiaceae bacterium]|nr:Gfo/Idh/MocA family oxidoreductase [Acidimicrobiaceae bacterium]